MDRSMRQEKCWKRRYSRTLSARNSTRISWKSTDSTRAKEAFQSMRERIDTDSNPAAAAWQALADLFVTET